MKDLRRSRFSRSTGFALGQLRLALQDDKPTWMRSRPRRTASSDAGPLEVQEDAIHGGDRRLTTAKFTYIPFSGAARSAVQLVGQPRQFDGEHTRSSEVVVAGPASSGALHLRAKRASTRFQVTADAGWIDSLGRARNRGSMSSTRCCAASQSRRRHQGAGRVLLHLSRDARTEIGRSSWKGAFNQPS